MHAQNTAGRFHPWMGMRRGRVFADKLKLLAMATLVVAVTKTYLVDLAVVEGRSMEPGLRSGDVVLVEKLTPRLGLVDRGEVVLLRAGTPEEMMVKRVVAIDGDEVMMRSGQAFLNRGMVPGEAETTPREGSWGPLTVPAGDVFVLGDNRPASTDGEHFGSVSARNVKGRVVAGVPRWASAASVRLHRMLHAADPKEATSLDEGPEPPAIINRSYAAMRRVTAVHVVRGDREMWISQDLGLRQERPDGFTLQTHEGTWQYSSKQNTVVVSDPVRIRQDAKDRMRALTGCGWLESLGCRYSPYRCKVSADSLGGRRAHRVETQPYVRGYGVTLWIDDQTLHVVAIREWRVYDGIVENVRPPTQLEYEMAVGSRKFLPTMPAGAKIDDRRTKSTPRSTA